MKWAQNGATAGTLRPGNRGGFDAFDDENSVLGWVPDEKTGMELIAARALIDPTGTLDSRIVAVRRMAEPHGRRRRGRPPSNPPKIVLREIPWHANGSKAWRPTDLVATAPELTYASHDPAI